MKGNKTLWRIHNWTGLYVGIVIGVLSLTGAIAVFIPEIESLFHKRGLELNEEKTEKIPVFQVLNSIQNNFPDEEILAIYPPQKEGDVYEFDLYSYTGESDNKRLKVYTDAASGKILKTVDHFNSIPNYLRQVHVRLMDGFYGRQLVGLAGIGLIIISITGLLIYGDFMKKQIFGSFRKGKNIRIVMADWHKMVGIAALVFNLVIALTGAWLGLQPKLMSWTGMKVPNYFTIEENKLTQEEDKTYEFDFETILAKSKTEIRGFIPIMVIPSVNGKRTVEVRGDIKGSFYEPHINKLVFDKLDNSVLFKYDVRDRPFWHRLYFVQEGLHFGRYAGLFTKVAYFLLGLTSGILSITGFVIYLKRKENKKSSGPSVGKVIFMYSAAIVGLLIFMGLATAYIGYYYVTVVITPAVYIFLALFIVYKVYQWVRRNKNNGQLKSPIDHKSIHKVKNEKVL